MGNSRKESDVVDALNSFGDTPSLSYPISNGNGEMAVEKLYPSSVSIVANGMSNASYFSAWEILPKDVAPLYIAVQRPELLPRHYEGGKPLWKGRK
ncbi:hypothetical protein RB195_010711 [Necator americanus]|uniref:Uncharacterized protein n=1 Tax=Necator americanus TaxID=51031 RepID=A0ABR1D0G0_NECAM